MSVTWLVVLVWIVGCGGGQPSPTTLAADVQEPTSMANEVLLPPTATPAPTSTPPADPTTTPLPTGSSPALLQVPADYPSIEAAIDAAQDGQEIVVAPGTYRENVDFGGKAVTLRSRDPDDPEVVAATIIDGGGEGSVVTFQSGETIRSVLAGFTLTNGRGNLFLSSQEQGEIACRGSVFGSREEKRFCGGGIVVVGAWPTIEKNVITGNRVRHGGGGIFVASSSFPIIRGNTITANEAGAAGGIFVIKDSWPTIEDNLIAENRVTATGGGILVEFQSYPRIENNTLRGNEGQQAGGGIMVFNYGQAVIQGNEIVENSTGQGGGGIFVGASSSATIQNNVLRGNTGAIGGGFFCELDCSITMEGNTFDENEASFSGGGINTSGCTLWIQGNAFAGNRASYGAGMYLDEGSVATVFKNEFARNVAQEPGGAIRVHAGAVLTLSEPDDNVYLDNQPDDVHSLSLDP